MLPSDASTQSYPAPEPTSPLKDPPAGNRRQTKRVWTPEEDAFVRDTFRKVRTREIASRLNRTRAAVYQRAIKVLSLPKTREGARGRKWQHSEETLMNEKYGKVQTNQLALDLQRTIASVHSRALILGLTKATIRGPHRPWIEEDERQVLATYGHVPVREIAARLNRSLAAVRLRAWHPIWGTKVTRRRSRSWTTAEDEALRSDYGHSPTRQVAEALGRTVSSVNSRAFLLCLTQHFDRAPGRKWTEAEDGFLRSAYGNLRPLEVAKRLGRTRLSVYHRAETLGLTAALGSPEYSRRQSLPRTAQPFTDLTNPVDIGYVAGIVDGEGSIVGPPKVTVQVSMTTREVIQRLHKLCGGSVSGPYENRSGRAEICLPQYHWTVSSAYSVYRLLRVLLPGLIVKKEKAEIVIQFLERKWSS